MRNTSMFAKLCVPLFLLGCHTSSSSVAPGSGTNEAASQGQAPGTVVTYPQQIEAPAPTAGSGTTGSAPSPRPADTAAPAPVSGPTAGPAAAPSTAPDPSLPTRRPAPSKRPAPVPDPPPSSLPASGATPGIGETCGPSDVCAAGLTCISYYGIAGPRGPQFKSCEVRCNGTGACPNGLTCMTVSDGPGRVCR